MGTKAGQTRADAGEYKARLPNPRQYARAPTDPAELALRGPLSRSAWEELRAATWERWLELVAEAPNDDHLYRRAIYAAQHRPGDEPDYELERRCRQPLRDAARDWPPHAARHDGIVGQVLSARFNRPQAYVNDWDARPRIVELAEQGLAEVEAFRKQNPTAAKSIAGPLREYARRLREVRDRPESRSL